MKETLIDLHSFSIRLEIVHTAATIGIGGYRELERRA